MISVKVIALGLSLATAIAAAGPASAAKCGRYGGWGIGVTTDIAKFMSDKATHQAMEKDNAKPIATLQTTCNNNALIYIQCHTTTKACAK
jgi:hypothetical protein